MRIIRQIPAQIARRQKASRVDALRGRLTDARDRYLDTRRGLDRAIIAKLDLFLSLRCLLLKALLSVTRTPPGPAGGRLGGEGNTDASHIWMFLLENWGKNRVDCPREKLRLIKSPPRAPTAIRAGAPSAVTYVRP
ncbi:hypothetical protein EVAR_103429_1 [Eumeta japonica]|uniref:Uncharacterized protein n=1 Tax=Eumeta variegata TaxID=151549 RepID=A0A4C1Z5Y4_EUMVA|nr:hypothetical protein EVAR_103429_1 [Eumeta japonica]